MFKTNIDTVKAGPFSGPMVVSMRAIKASRIDEVKAISHTSLPTAPRCTEISTIGINDITVPDWGDPIPIEDGEMAVFWACGVTPQAAIQNANLPLCITHKPGQMLITDISENAETPTKAAE